MSHPVIRCGRSKAFERPNEAMRIIARCPEGIAPSTRRGGFSLEDAAAELAPGIAKRMRKNEKTSD